ncbi:hypothetical protein ACFOVU_05325 [Nocardiopsis sediminis]|uniref:Uncharacterized protein n=1 Tax=Nocardiopsis sediminis TaxID=1778267 RepID=A0ABV8FK07_9ACTN
MGDPDGPDRSGGPARVAGRKGRLAAWVVPCVVAVQVLVPSFLLLSGADRPARFGWHMYSTVPTWPDVTAVHADGTASEFTRRSIRAGRGDVALDDALLDAACRGDRSIVEFHVRRAPDTTDVHRCAGR